MLYNEFIIGTGCKDTPENYQVYKDLEIMYMNSDISKASIYEYGKKLVNNDPTAAEIETGRTVRAEIEFINTEIETRKSWISGAEKSIKLYDAPGDADFRNCEREYIRTWKKEIQDLKARRASFEYLFSDLLNELKRAGL